MNHVETMLAEFIDYLHDEAMRKCPGFMRYTNGSVHLDQMPGSTTRIKIVNDFEVSNIDLLRNLEVGPEGKNINTRLRIVK